MAEQMWNLSVEPRVAHRDDVGALGGCFRRRLM